MKCHFLFDMDKALSLILKWSKATANAVSSPAVVELIMPFLAKDTTSCPCTWHQRIRRLCKLCKLVLRLGVFVMLMLEFTTLQTVIDSQSNSSSKFNITIISCLKTYCFFFPVVVFLACYLNYYCLVVFCRHLLLRVRTLLLGRVLVSHVAPGKAQLNIDLNDLDISPCVTDIATFSHYLFWYLIIPFHNKGICLLSNTQT